MRSMRPMPVAFSQGNSGDSEAGRSSGAQEAERREERGGDEGTVVRVDVDGGV